MVNSGGQIGRSGEAVDPSPRGRDSGNIFAAVVSLARSATSTHRLTADLLHLLGKNFNSPYAAAHIRYSSEVFQEDYHSGPTDPAFWKPSVQELLTDTLAEPKPRLKVLQSKRGKSVVALLAAPMFDHREVPIGAFALVAPVNDSSDAKVMLATFEALLRVATVVMEQQRSAATAATVPAKPVARQFESPEQLAFWVTNDLRNKTGCEQVALGQVFGPRVELLSVSGFDEVHREGPGVKALLAAMEECLDSARPQFYPPESGSDDDSLRYSQRLHKQWHQAVRGDCVASIPLRNGEETVAILSLRRVRSAPFASPEIEKLRVQLEPLMPTLQLTRLARRSLWRHGRDSVRTGLAVLIGPGRWRTKTIAILMVAATAALLFGSMEHRVHVPCTLAPSALRHVSVPFDGVLYSASVVQGDSVSVGQILCGFDSSDLQRQRSELLAQLAVVEREQDKALALESAVDAKLAQANQVLIQARLKILDRRIEQATVRAPIDGVVVSGDMRRRIGEVLPRGEPLFQIAARGSWKVELQIPQDELTEIGPELTGVFAAHARPEVQRGFRIQRILPKPETRKQRTVYVAEGVLTTMGISTVDSRQDGAGHMDSWMRPGMEGVAAVRVGPRRIAWIVSHRIMNFLRMHLWL